MNRKLNVLHLRSSKGKGGGPEKTLINSPRFIDKDKFNMTLVYLKSFDDRDFDMVERAQKFAVELIAISEHFKIDIGALKQLKKILIERQIDIFHGHCYKSNIYGLILRCFYRMKLVTTVHGWASQNNKVKIYDALDKKIQRFFNKVIIVTPTLYDELLKYKVKKENLIFVPNAIDIEYFEKNPHDNLRSTFKIDQNAFVIGAVGRLAKEKDFVTFIKAAQLLKEKNKQIFFMIFGEGIEKQNLNNLIKELSLEENVILTGHVADSRKIFNTLNAYVLSSLQEGLPNTILEAMAMKVPIINTPVGGVQKILNDNDDSLWFPVGDFVQLAQNILKLISCSQLQEKLTQNARLKVEKNFSFIERMKHIQIIYENLYSEKNR